MTASRIVIAAFVGFCTLAAFGQNQPPGTGTPDPTNSPAQGQPSGGPVTGARDSSQNSGNQNNPAQGQTPNPSGATPAVDENGQLKLEGPDIVDDPNATPEQKASAEYSGPAVLSRGISASEPMNPKNIKFTPSVGVEYIYNQGLTGIQSNGTASNGNASGVQLNYSVTGEKVLKQDTLSLSFVGDLYHYPNASIYDGTDDQLSFTWRHKLSRHFQFGIRESLQEYNRNNLLLSGTELINSGAGTTLVTSTPQTEAFDGRVFNLFNEGNLTWQLSSRFSINLSGGGFMTRRASTSLYGDVGYQAGADIAYRLTRSVTVGGYYGYTHFDYIGIYGGSDINTVGVTYSIAFNGHTELITRIGGSRVETTGLNSVALNPFLAELLGTPTTVEAVYSKNYTPDFNLQLRRKLTNLSVSLAFSRGITPGNGVILTAVSENIGFGVNYKAMRRWNLASSTGYSTLSGFGSTDQKYASVYTNASVYRALAKHLEWHFRVDYHHYTFDNTGFLRNTFVFSSGLMWTPGDLLERLW